MPLSCCGELPQKQAVATRMRFVCGRCDRGGQEKYCKSELAAVRAWNTNPSVWDRMLAPYAPQGRVGRP